MELCPFAVFRAKLCNGISGPSTLLSVNVLLPSSVPIYIYKSGAVTFFISAPHLTTGLGRHCYTKDCQRFKVMLHFWD